jgi:hypothetical protein
MWWITLYWNQLYATLLDVDNKAQSMPSLDIKTQTCGLKGKAAYKFLFEDQLDQNNLKYRRFTIVS